jgi:hypothetical protein
MHLRTAWSDYFTGTPTLIQKTEYGTNQTLSNTNVHVSNCLFRSITSSNNGGALSCSSVSCLLIESTSFFSCKTSSNYGGAVQFYNINSGQCVLYKICGYDCRSTHTGISHGQFSRIFVYNVATSKNYFNYSSVARCVTEISNSYFTVLHQYGKVSCISVNITMNKCYCRSGIISQPFNEKNSVISSLAYSSFVDNIAIWYTCIQLWTSGSKHEIKSCNILRNTQGTLDSEGTIYANGNVMIEDSCILENKATYIFRQSLSYTITLSNCTVDKTTNTGGFSIQSTVTKSFILALSHISTQNCASEYDSVGTLTPIAQNKQIICYTYIKISYQHRLSYLIQLISIFLFNFIHLDISNDLLN